MQASKEGACSPSKGNVHMSTSKGTARTTHSPSRGASCSPVRELCAAPLRDCTYDTCYFCKVLLTNNTNCLILKRLQGLHADPLKELYTVWLRKPCPAALRKLHTTPLRMLYTAPFRVLHAASLRELCPALLKGAHDPSKGA